MAPPPYDDLPVRLRAAMEAFDIDTWYSLLDEAADRIEALNEVVYDRWEVAMGEDL